MRKDFKKADFTIVSVPTYATTECPYCESEFDIDYSEFCVTDYPFDTEGEIVECPECGEEIVVENIDFD